MHPLFQDAVGFVIGSIVSLPANMFLLEPLGQLLGTPPFPDSDDGAQLSTYIKSLEPHHFISPLLAHWNGAFMGAATAALITASRGPKVPLAVAAFVMAGGVTMIYIIPDTPLLFSAVDLAGYLPAGYLGFLVAQQLRGR